LSHHGAGEAVGLNGQLLQSHGAKDRKRRREATQNRRTTGGGGGAGAPEVELHQPSPPPPQVQLLFLEPRLQARVRVASLQSRHVPSRLTPPSLRCNQAPGFQMPAAACGMKGRARIGRGGRLIFDRVDPITREPFAEPVKFAPSRPPVAVDAMDVS
jgi:hypothetical protein